MQRAHSSRNKFLRTSVCARRNTTGGFGLLETLIGVAVFVLVSVSIYGGYTKILQGIQVLKVKNAAASLANEQIEIVRNLPYVDVGVVDGLPAGKIPRNQVLTRDGIDFDVEVSVRDIDDPFDGQIGQTPNDLSPADYRLVQYDISCSECPYQETLTFYSRVSPQNLETQGNNGALFVQVFDSSGQPISGANVHIENNQSTTTISIDETTNNDGMFQIVDAPPGVEAYEITVTKDGYSTEQTYTVGAPENPAPNLPHANVVSGEVTQVSFAIDELSDLFIETKNAACDLIPFVDMNVRGSKTIGVDVYKFEEDLATDSSGQLDLEDIEWDNYTFTVTDSGYDLAGTSELLPIDLVPASTKNLDLIMTSSNPNSLLVQVKDAETGLPLSDATVTLSNSGNDNVLVTSRGFVKQTDWSGGSGQAEIGDETKYLESDGNIDTGNPAGDLVLFDVGGTYFSSGNLTSSTFDVGTTTNFHALNWGSFDQPTEVGAESIRFQLASNEEVTATTTWDFIGPDGTSSTYYVSPGEAIAEDHDGDRYFRYKVFMSTDSTSHTPTLSDVSITFASDCAPPGQVFFTGLELDVYSLQVDLEDHQQFYIENFLLTEEWQLYEVILSSDEE